MESVLLALGLVLSVLAVLVVLACAVAAWEHRARIVARRALWVVSDDDIRAFQAHAQAVDAKLLAATAATAALEAQSADAPVNEQQQRRATLRNAMRRMTDGLPPQGSGRPRRLPSTAGPAVPESASMPTAVAQAAALVSNGLALFSAAMPTHGRWEDTQPMVLTSHPVHFDPTVADSYSTQ
jgi:hypothetical protein